MLDEKGMPTPVEVAYIYPPKSQLTPLVVAERDALVKQDDLYAYTASMWITNRHTNY
ncbi:ATPase [Actinobacillus pleuropneumoniae]|nr:ATPase [Actinobacillus pleuropneumoniae]